VDLALDADLARVPIKVLEEWANLGFPSSLADFESQGPSTEQTLRAIPYKELDLNLPWRTFNVRQELTTKGIQKFVGDRRDWLSSRIHLGHVH
jgi:hypothetical protein